MRTWEVKYIDGYWYVISNSRISINIICQNEKHATRLTEAMNEVELLVWRHS